MVPPMSGLQILTGRVVALALGATLTVAACSGSSPPPVPEEADGTKDPVLVLGREVYGENCSNCHASDGSGKRGPRLSGGAVVERFPNPADQVEVVTDGRGGMPAFGSELTPEEIDAVVLYTREVL